MRTLHHGDFDPAALSGEVSVCLPAKECAATVGGIVEQVVGLPFVAEVVVVDAASADGTADVARAAGAVVHQEAELLPDVGPVRGKGDAMWRALTVLRGDVVCFVDADTQDFGAHFVTGLCGPLLTDEGVDFVKAFYRRPLGDDPAGGGRVNHLMARPALRVFFPELADVRQPLAGEIAARRDLLERLPFATGYGVETAMLIDVWRAVGIERMAQVDLGTMTNAHQPLQDLVPMAESVLRVVASHAGVDTEGVPERPPHRS